MIAADYLYTNYLCRIATILSGEVESQVDKKNKRLTLRFAGTEIYFRYNKNGFILKNQYGEKRVHPLIESFIALLIKKALKENEVDMEIKINGNKVDTDIRLISFIGYLWRIYSHHDDFPMHGCRWTNSCPFASICKQERDSVITTEARLRNMLREGLEILHETNGLFVLLSSKDDEMYLKILDYLFERDAGTNMWDDKIDGVKMKIARDIGYGKADTVVELVLKKILDEVEPFRGKLRVGEYDGYLVEKDGIVIPGDKVWRELLGRDMEKNVLKFYEKAGFFNLKEVKK